jgi:hypothetical protein
MAAIPPVTAEAVTPAVTPAVMAVAEATAGAGAVTAAAVTAAVVTAAVVTAEVVATLAAAGGVDGSKTLPRMHRKAPCDDTLMLCDFSSAAGGCFGSGLV